jgi:phosphoglycerate kinase
MNLPKLTDFDFKGKRVLVRGDLDVPLKDGVVEDDTRIKESLPTIKYLLEEGAQVILLGHLGRPEGKVVEELSLKPVAEKIKELLSPQLQIVELTNCELGGFKGFGIGKNLTVLENLRFFPGEESNDPEFARKLASLGDFYVNEAFATSYRAHASIVGVPQLLPHAAGLHFASEVENLSRAIENPAKPLVVIIGGAKPETKLPMLEEFAKKADWVLVGGTLAKGNIEKKPQNVLSANLTNDGFDINEKSIEKFSGIIKTAGTIVWNGPMGKYEEEKWEVGTRKISQAIADSSAFKIVGGGDTIAALTKFNLIDKMGYVSTGGGAMLGFLAKGMLPGIEALK